MVVADRLRAAPRPSRSSRRPASRVLAQRGRRASAARAALDRVPDRRAAGRPARRPRRPPGAPVVVSGLARDVDGAAAREARRDRRVAPVGQGRRRQADGSFAVTVQAEGHRDLPAHGRRPGRPGGDDHRPRGTAEVTVEGSGRCRRALRSPRRGSRRRTPHASPSGSRPAADRAAVAQRLRDARSNRDRRPRPDPGSRGLGPSRGGAAGRAGRALRRGATGQPRQSFVPNDPFLPRQWYAAQNRAFDAWTEPPPLAAGAGRRDRLGHRRHPSRAAAAGSPPRRASSAGPPRSTRRATGRSWPG